MAYLREAPCGSPPPPDEDRQQGTSQLMLAQHMANLASQRNREKGERCRLMQHHGISELDAAPKIAEHIDRARSITSLQHGPRPQPPH